MALNSILKKSYSYHFVVLAGVLMFCFCGFVFFISPYCFIKLAGMGGKAGRFRCIFLNFGGQPF